MYTSVYELLIGRRVLLTRPNRGRRKRNGRKEDARYLEYDDPDGDSAELGMGKPGDARLGLTFGHCRCPGGGVLDAAVSASDHIFGLVGGNGMPQS